MGYLSQLFQIIFNTQEEPIEEEDYTSYESWYAVLENYTYEELQELADNYNLYHINIKLQGFRICIDYMSNFFSKNKISNKYYKKDKQEW